MSAWIPFGRLPPSFHSHNFLNYPVNARCYSGFHRDDLGRRSTRSIRVLVILYIGVRMALVSGSPFPFFSFLDRSFYRGDRNSRGTDVFRQGIIKGHWVDKNMAGITCRYLALTQSWDRNSIFIHEIKSNLTRKIHFVEIDYYS